MESADSENGHRLRRRTTEFETPERRSAADSGRVHVWVSGDSWEATNWREGGASQGPAAYSSGNGGNDSNGSKKPAIRISSEGVHEHAVRAYKPGQAEGENNGRRRGEGCVGRQFVRAWGAVYPDGNRHEKKKHEVRAAVERRRALELELELEKLRASRREESTAKNAKVLEISDALAELSRYSKWLSGALPKFPAEVEVPVWFEAVEHTQEAYAVPKEHWGQIVFPLMAEKVRLLSTRLTPSQHREYEVLEKVVLEELKLSGGEYRRMFLTSKKLPSEGWRAFATSLQSYFNCYVEERGVNTFEGLVELLEADQLKNTLSEEAIPYVTLQEGEG
ncbi:hypothetical protein HPB48_016155 [Haemaphysalis longicornis]|uniref:Uncharacterized protein n=1 Tax=Haemaphysalis longicornis TaxID=44386 RepID=A0A9J6FQD6_HAELO|nr:hypothetical protein HPB48_016155 [Haemaphysalis longicornis]